ncbi:MAG: uroporphyrinogen-III C-methyltransferase [Syntrophales bacterium]|nr:uroporphyrinogen-III C-methyltransferase [Syntrophales bacterium]
MQKQGKVYIIGGGPGDPGLVTLRAVECLSRAQVVVYDYLVSREILNHAPAEARLIYVGKQGGDHSLSQDEINRVLVQEAMEGRVVARLKGGDPFIFGRGGEEALILAEHGIPFEIIPGISSAVAVPAYAGIPLTQREFTSTVAFVTGHEDPTKPESRLHWEHLAPLETLVFLMGVKNLPTITEKLMEHGKDPETPAILIRWGTTADQESLEGTLGTIASLARERGMTPPAIFVAGEVVGLRDKLAWFEKKPLFGKGIVITRPEGQAREFAGMLREKGARVTIFPVISIVPNENPDRLDEAIAAISTYQWIIFTSANSVRFFFERLRFLGKDLRELKGLRVATIGPATAAAIEAMGIRVDIVPDEYISEGVVKAFEGVNLKGAKILLPRAETARDVIPGELASRGASVDVITVYRTEGSGRDGSELTSLMNEGRVDVLTFTSPSTVKHCIEIIGGIEQIPSSVAIACIGPVTEAAARKAGLRVDIMQGPYDMKGFVSAIEEGLRKMR